MAQQTINLGTAGTNSGDTVRNAFDICNDNFTELYGGKGAVIYHGSQLSQSYSSSTSSSYSNTTTIVSSVPAGTYIIILSIAGSTTLIGDSGFIKIRDASMGDITGLWAKWSKHQVGTDDSGNSVTTNMVIATLTQTCNLYGQYKRLAGSGTVYLSDIKLAMIKVA